MTDAAPPAAPKKRGRPRKPPEPAASRKARKDKELRRRLMTKTAQARAEALATLPPVDRPPTRGGPLKYRPAFAEMARKMCELGATDHELGEAFCVGQQTIWNWTVRFPEFARALELGKAAADKRVERAFYNRAVGYNHPAKKIMQHQGKPVVVDYVEHVPPDVTAAAKWLASRVGGEWLDRRTVEHTGADGRTLGEEMGVDTMMATARWIADALASGSEAQSRKMIDVTPEDPPNGRTRK